MVGAVFLVNVGQDFITAVVLKIKVNIRELAALDIKESFENKPICQRVDISDAQTVKSQAGSSTSPNTKIDAPFSGKGDYIPNNEEVMGKFCLLDDIKLIAKPFLDL